MPVAHVCISCGTSLTRLRAAPDPYYGLRIVICPTCRRATVRRQHPLRVGWRRAHAVRQSLGHLLFTPIATLALLAGSLFGAGLTLDLLRALNSSWIQLHADVLSGRASAWQIPTWMRGSGEPFSPLIIVVFSLLAGMLMSIGLTHWRKWLLIPAWVAIWNAVVFLPMLLRTADGWIKFAAASLLGEGSVESGHSTPFDLSATFDLSAASAYSLFPFTLGILGAPILGRLAGANTRRRWLKRRRALKRRRESQ